MHEKPKQRASWEYHGVKGWYIAPAPEHYRCIKCYVPKTQSVRITDTEKIIPRCIPIPEANIEDHIRQKATDLFTLLKQENKKVALPGGYTS